MPSLLARINNRALALGWSIDPDRFGGIALVYGPQHTDCILFFGTLVQLERRLGDEQFVNDCAQIINALKARDSRG